jgi:hypothetical protein
MAEIQKRIDGFLSLIDDKDIRDQYRSELEEYARKTYQWTEDTFGGLSPYVIALALLPREKLTKQQITVVEKQGSFLIDLSKTDIASRIPQKTLSPLAYNAGTAGNMYFQDIQKLIKEKMSDFEKLNVKPTYFGNVNMRNIAEMTVRFERYQEQKRELIDRGVSLVYVRPHSNCSKRCQPFQGRLYSLNGTKGSIDGRSYIPIEDVSEKQTYTSERTGRTYLNGLFAYNCRHVMEEYKRGMNFEEIPDDVIERQRGLEAKQREMERNYRAMREKEELYRILAKRSGNKDVLAIATATRKKAAAYREQYVAFSKKNDLAYFPNRLQIMAGENRYIRTVGKNDKFAQAAFKMKNEA